MSKWEKVKLGDVCDVRDGTHDSPKYVLDGYPLVTSKNIVNGIIDITNVNYISKEDFDKINVRSGVDDGDIIMPMIGTIGNPVIVRKSFVFAIKNVALIKFANSAVLNKYIYYILSSSIFKNYIQRENRGGTQKFLSLSNIRNFEFPLPSLDTQKQIAKTLDTAAELLAMRKQQLAELDSLIKSVFYEMFGDPAINDKGWEIGTIKDLASRIQYGTSQKASTEKLTYPILRMNNITYEGSMDLSDLKYIELSEKDKDKYLVYKGEMLFNRTNSKELVGKTSVFREDEPMAFAGYLVKLVPNHRANSEFISAFLNSSYGKRLLFNMAKSIVGMANINAKELGGIKIYIPPLHLQNQFATIVAKIEEQKALVKKAIEETQTLFDSLMAEYFED